MDLLPFVPAGVFLLGIVTLIWTRLPDYSPLRSIERLAAVRASVRDGSAAAIALDDELDRRVTHHLRPLQVRRAQWADRIRVIVAVLALNASVVSLVLAIYNVSQGLPPLP